LHFLHKKKEEKMKISLLLVVHFCCCFFFFFFFFLFERSGYRGEPKKGGFAGKGSWGRPGEEMDDLDNGLDDQLDGDSSTSQQ